jgi:uncharacterized protein YndB with AHSA1/START domain
MTRQKSFKERIRARMDKTGESYATARRQLIEKSEAEQRKRKTPQSVSPVRTNDEALRAATGRTYNEWFKLLDKWGAKEQKHREIARWLSGEQGVDGWWSQHVTVAYEQERGLRAPGQRPDGTYSVSASKTVDVAVKTLYEAFHDEETRAHWLGEFELVVRSTRPSKSMTAAWEDTSTRLTVSFEPKGSGKSVVALAHERIPDARQADDLKTFWRERLVLLKKMLES